MSESQRLRLRDVRSVYRLIGECCDLGSDSPAWRRHMLQSLCRLVGAQVGNGAEARWIGPDRLFAPVLPSVVDLGWAGVREREFFLEWVRSTAPEDDPKFQRLARLRARLITCVREKLIDDAEWYRSGQFNEYHKRSRIDHFILSLHTLGRPDHVNVTGLNRELGARPFSRRERRIVHLFHHELGPLIGKRLATPGIDPLAGLSPRLRQTLACLLEGDGEKQVAARLGLSRATVHQYVGALYRRFGVHSRGELLALWVRLGRPPGRPPESSAEFPDGLR